MTLAKFYVPNMTHFSCGITVNGSRIYLDFKPQNIGSIRAAVYATADAEIAIAMRKDPYFNTKWFEHKEKVAEKAEKKSPKQENLVLNSKEVPNLQMAKKYLTMNGYCKPADFNKKSALDIARANHIWFEVLENEAPTS